MPGIAFSFGRRSAIISSIDLSRSPFGTVRMEMIPVLFAPSEGARGGGQGAGQGGGRDATVRRGGRVRGQGGRGAGTAPADSVGERVVRQRAAHRLTSPPGAAPRTPTGRKLFRAIAPLPT